MVVGEAGSERVEEMDLRFVRAGVRVGCEGGFLEEFERFETVVEREIEGRERRGSRSVCELGFSSSKRVPGGGWLSEASWREKTGVLRVLWLER